MTDQRSPRIALVAGEASGDALGADLIEALRERYPKAHVFGMAGPRMRALGCQALADSEEIAVMGLAEVIGHLPRLLRLRSRLLREIAAAAPDLFVGIDSPDFNLGLARRLRSRVSGLRTVQYVSPQFWAWRSGRVKRIGESVDHVLCLLPFEAEFYAEHGVGATFTGHPLADRVPMTSNPDRARAALGLPSDDESPVVAVLPGSREGEVRRLAQPLGDAMRWLLARRPAVRFVSAMANPTVRSTFETLLAEQPGSPLPLALIDGRASEVMAAADVVLLASGTATLEALLIKRPMVVCYRVSPVSAWVARRLKLMTTERFSLPNLLAGADLVPEIMQEAVSGEALGAAVLEQLEASSDARARLTSTYERLHRILRRGASQRAAQALHELLQGRGEGLSSS
ncbi:MAG: lipid-A-disaccharide synthase [Pseudomonadota bacterium]